MFHLIQLYLLVFIKKIIFKGENLLYWSSVVNESFRWGSCVQDGVPND